MNPPPENLPDLLPETPECKKMAAVKNDSHKLGEFIDWLRAEGIQLCEWTEYEDARAQFRPIMETEEKLLARYFEIDLDKVETERRATLEYHRREPIS